MIDREKRDLLAENLRHLVSGQISNDEFQDRLRGSKDAAVGEVFLCAGWPLYDDLHEHKLIGKWAIGPESKEIIARSILFLKKNFEYEWPRETGILQFPWILLSILTLGIGGRIRSKARDWLSGGDRSVWPFFRRTDYEQALKQPPYLKQTHDL